MIQPVELAKAYRLLNHGPVVLVSSASGGARNVMAAAWTMPLDYTPPKVAAVIAADTYTRELVEASGELVLNVPCRRLAGQVLAAGSRSGRDGDKLAAIGLEALPSAIVAAPRIGGCVAWLECRIVREPENQARYDLFVAEVVAAAADPRAFRDGRWSFQEDDLRTLHHVAGGHFFVTGEELAVGAG
jgi:flavin reductase (DIM6/NTAB) family NADH-FMN oxidoreductase RutF